MQAQRARGHKAVDSYESESSVVSLLIRADELPFYEACVCVEAILGLRARFGVGTRSAEHEIDLAYKTVEIRYCRRIPPFRVGTQRVGWERRAVNRAWEIRMYRDAKGIKLRVGDRQGLPT